jgi:hypothetical protein
MNRTRFTALSLALVVVLSSCLLTSPSAFAQSAEDYFKGGKAYLESNQLSPAHTYFQAAISLEPNHQGANLFFALTRILMISQSSGFNTLLDRAGLSPTGRDVFNWTADFTRDPEGNILLPSTSPTSAELQAFLRDHVLPEMNGALGNLSQVTSSFETMFRSYIESSTGAVSGLNILTDNSKFWETNEFAGLKISVSETEYTIVSNTWNTITVSPNWSISPGNYSYGIFEPIEIDYGDVLLLKGSLTLGRAGVSILTAYNVDVDIDSIASLVNAGTFDIQTSIINAYPQLLTLLPGHLLSQAKSIVREGLNLIASAIDFVEGETDPQNFDLFIIDDPLELQEYRDLLADLNSALDGTTLIRKNGLYVNLSEFFDNPKVLRNYLPTFLRDRFVKGNTFPDPTFGGILPLMTPAGLIAAFEEMTLFPDWMSLPGRTVSPPSLVWQPVFYDQTTLTMTEKLMMVVRAADDSIWTATFDQRGMFNNDWASIPGRTSSPPALAWNPNQMEVQMVVQASDGSIWASTFSLSGQFNHDWVNVPGRADSPPSLAWNPAANKLQMLVRAADDSLWMASFGPTGAFNNDWASIPGRTVSPPALAWNAAAARMQLVVRASDDSIWVASFDTAGNFNNDWTSIPGRTIEPPALAWDDISSELCMVVRASDDSIWFATFNSTGTFNNDWVSIPGRTVSPPGMVHLPSIGYLEIVVRAADDSLWRMLY